MKSLTEFPKAGKRLRSLRFSVWWLAILLFSSAGTLLAQKDAGSIVGLVRDPSGAVVPGAKVAVQDVDRGTQFVTTTNLLGEYVASPLKVGRYQVTVEKPGFMKAVSQTVTVDVQARVAVDVALKVGSVSESVTVTSRTPQLETETSELGHVVNSRVIRTLPLNGRNYAQLALLGAGVAPAEPGSRVESSYGFSSNGARSLQNNFLLDGVDNNSNLGDVLNETAYVIQPSVDAIQEFKVETNAYSSEFGRGNGAILNAVIKSGTNQFHGDVYEFIRNEVLDGRNAFDAFGRQPYKQNQFGFTFGGPIVKNRTFFFGDYEGLRIRQATPWLVSIPTPAMISGDFSSFLTNTPVAALDPTTGLPNGAIAWDCNGNPTYVGELFNTRLTQQVPVGPSYPTGLCGFPINGGLVPTNKIPVIDPLAARLAALYPPPNVNLAGGNYLSDPKKSENRNNFDIRIDQTFSDKDNLFGRFSYEDQPSFIPSPFSNPLDGGSFADGHEDDSYRSIAISEVHTFRSTLANEFRLGYNRINAHRLNLNYNQNVSAELGFPGVPFGPDIGGLPSLTFSDGTVSIGSYGYLPSVEKQNTFVLNENLNWVRGRHSLKLGTEVRHEQFTIYQPASPRGMMTFGSDFTDNPAQPGTGGEAFATFLLGIPDSGTITNLHNVDYRRWVSAVFAQDDFQVTPRLTLNLGLRYELFGTIHAYQNQQANFDFATQSLIVPKGQNAQLTPLLSTQLPILRNGTPGLISPDVTDFAPRLGLAFKFNEKTVLRAGYGIFYGGEENGPFSNPSPGFNPPFFVTQAFSMPCPALSANPALGSVGLDCSIPGLNVLFQGFPANSLIDPNTPTLYSIDGHLKTPYTQQWHLGVQRELAKETVLEMSYAGSKGSRLYGFYNGNQAVPTANSSLPTAPRRPDPNIDTAIDTLRSNIISNYNSLQLRLQQRLAHGLQFQASYTYSHALDDASSASLGSGNNGDFRDQRYPMLEYGNADFDVRHRLVISYAYELPFGKGKLVGGDASGFLNQIIGNWQAAGITSASRGNWFTVTDAVTNVSNSDNGGTVGVYTVRPNVVGNPNAHPCVTGTLFNTCAFAPNAIQGTFGDAGRNIVKGPGLQEWDISLMKLFPVREQMRFEFRAEFFNAFNHVNPLFGIPGEISEEPTTLERGTPQFGFPAAARPPRQVQFALKFYF